MAGSNFQQWNPNGVNQESDVLYAADSLRAGGAPLNAIFPSALANKLFFQVAIFVAAFGQMMAGKGYTISDGSSNPPTALANLTGVLSDVITSPELINAINNFAANFVNSIGVTGYQKFPGGLILQWVTGASMSTVVDNQTQDLTFSIPFPTACDFAICSEYGAGISSDAYVQITVRTLTKVTVLIQKTVPQISTPPGGGNITPVCIAIGH